MEEILCQGCPNHIYITKEKYKDILSGKDKDIILCGNCKTILNNIEEQSRSK